MIRFWFVDVVKRSVSFLINELEFEWNNSYVDFCLMINGVDKKIVGEKNMKIY